MKIAKYNPSEALKAYVNSILIVESDTDVTNNLLPGIAPVMAFRFKGTVHINDAIIPGLVITGMTKVARSARYTPGSGVLLVLFSEGGAAAFTDVPLHEFSGFSTDLNNIFPADQLRSLEDHLGAAGTNAEKVSVVERFLLAHLKYDENDAVIIKAVSMIKAGNGNFKIKELVSVLNTNMDSFEKKFRSRVGISPKNYSSIIRIRSVINSYRSGQNLTDISLETGFSDQSHFNKDFKAFTGQSPRKFFKSNPSQW